MPDEDSESQILVVQWKQACTTFDITVRATISALVTTLDLIANVLAQNDQARVHFGSVEGFWSDLRKLWRDLARAQFTFWDGDDSEGEGGESQETGHDLRFMCGSLAKFTRNLVAGVPQNQTRAIENEPDIRRLLHYHTSWTAMEDEQSIAIARTLAQALSNIVTTNEPLMSNLWNIYMDLPEDQVILIRLLASPDPRTLLTVFIFILNCIHGSRKRAKMLTRTTVGARVCISLLDDMLKLYDAEESSEGAQAFDVGYDILTHLIEQGLVPDLYSKFIIPDEIVTPHQTTLLKIVDSYLQSVQMNATLPTPQGVLKTQRKISPMLASCFLELSTYARLAVERALVVPPSTASNPSTGFSAIELENGQESSQPLPPADLDVMLPKVCEALVLVTQCIVTITLGADEPEHTDQGVKSEYNLKSFFNETRSNDRGLVESLIELLRLLDSFLPRINFGKPVTNSSGTPTPTQQFTADGTGFQYLKRDLVRLLGVLCHGRKAVQDRTRDCGGIEVVMNLCVVDERNPYLREHAIFTLRCLLEDNRENQAVVDAIQPREQWDEDGVLRDTPRPRAVHK